MKIARIQINQQENVKIAPQTVNIVQKTYVLNVKKIHTFMEVNVFQTVHQAIMSLLENVKLVEMDVLTVLQGITVLPAKPTTTRKMEFVLWIVDLECTPI